MADWLDLFEYPNDPLPSATMQDTFRGRDADISDALRLDAAHSDGRSSSRKESNRRDADSNEGDLFGGGHDQGGISDAEEREMEGPAMVRFSKPEKKNSMASIATIVQNTAGNRKFLSAAQAKMDELSSSDESGSDTPGALSLLNKFEQVCARNYRPRTYDDTESCSEESSVGPRRNRTAHRGECFLCAWGDRFHDGIAAPAVNRLHAILDKNYGQIENAAIAQMMHAYFKKKVYQPSTGMKMLTAKACLEHIEQMHTLDPRIMLGENIRRVQKMIIILQDEIFYGNGSFGRFQQAALQQTMRTLISLYKSDPVKMNFYDAKRDINTATMGATMNIRALFTVQRPPSRHQRSKRPRDEPSESSCDDEEVRPEKKQRSSGKKEDKKEEEEKEKESPAPRKTPPHFDF